MTLTTSDVISLAALVAALLALVGYYNRVFLWVQKQGRQDKDIESIKEEQRVLCVGLLRPQGKGTAYQPYSKSGT